MCHSVRLIWAVVAFLAAAPLYANSGFDLAISSGNLVVTTGRHLHYGVLETTKYREAKWQDLLLNTRLIERQEGFFDFRRSLGGGVFTTTTAVPLADLGFPVTVNEARQTEYVLYTEFDRPSLPAMMNYATTANFAFGLLAGPAKARKLESEYNKAITLLGKSREVAENVVFLLNWLEAFDEAMLFVLDMGEAASDNAYYKYSAELKPCLEGLRATLEAYQSIAAEKPRPIGSVLGDFSGYTGFQGGKASTKFFWKTLGALGLESSNIDRHVGNLGASRSLQQTALEVLIDLAIRPLASNGLNEGSYFEYDGDKAGEKIRVSVKTLERDLVRYFFDHKLGRTPRKDGVSASRSVREAARVIFKKVVIKDGLKSGLVAKAALDLARKIQAGEFVVDGASIAKLGGAVYEQALANLADPEIGAEIAQRIALRMASYFVPGAGWLKGAVDAADQANTVLPFAIDAFTAPREVPFVIYSEKGADNTFATQAAFPFAMNLNKYSFLRYPLFEINREDPFSNGKYSYESYFLDGNQPAERVSGYVVNNFVPWNANARDVTLAVSGVTYSYDMLLGSESSASFDAVFRAAGGFDKGLYDVRFQVERHPNDDPEAVPVTFTSEYTGVKNQEGLVLPESHMAGVFFNLFNTTDYRFRRIDNADPARSSAYVGVNAFGAAAKRDVIYELLSEKVPGTNAAGKADYLYYLGFREVFASALETKYGRTFSDRYAADRGIMHVTPGVYRLGVGLEVKTPRGSRVAGSTKFADRQTLFVMANVSNGLADQAHIRVREGKAPHIIPYVGRIDGAVGKDRYFERDFNTGGVLFAFKLNEVERFDRPFRLAFMLKPGSGDPDFWLEATSVSIVTVDPRKDAPDSTGYYRIPVSTEYFDLIGGDYYLKEGLRIAWYDDVLRAYAEYTGASEVDLVKRLLARNARARSGAAVTGAEDAVAKAVMVVGNVAGDTSSAGGFRLANGAKQTVVQERMPAPLGYVNYARLTVKKAALAMENGSCWLTLDFEVPAGVLLDEWNSPLTGTGALYNPYRDIHYTFSAKTLDGSAEAGAARATVDPGTGVGRCVLRIEPSPALAAGAGEVVTLSVVYEGTHPVHRQVLSFSYALPLSVADFASIDVGALPSIVLERAAGASASGSTVHYQHYAAGEVFRLRFRNDTLLSGYSGAAELVFCDPSGATVKLSATFSAGVAAASFAKEGDYRFVGVVQGGVFRDCGQTIFRVQVADATTSPNALAVRFVSETLPDGSYLVGKGIKSWTFTVGARPIVGLKAVQKANPAPDPFLGSVATEIAVGNVAAGQSFTVSLPLNVKRSGVTEKSSHWELRDAAGALVDITNSATDSFWVKVLTNRSPRFLPSQLESVSAQVGKEANLPVLAEDPDGDGLNYAVVEGGEVVSGGEEVAVWGLTRNIVAGGWNGKVITAISAGKWHSLALQTDGRVIADGYDWDGQSTVPDGLVGVKAVAAGYWHSLALKNDGSVVSWGFGGSGLGDIPAGLSDVIAIAAGEYHSLALKTDGSVVAWGTNNEGQLSVPEGLSRVKAISAGGRHSLALCEDGTVVAWGLNGDGQCDVPVGLSGVKAIAAGGRHSLALKEDGTVVAWGSNSDGQCSVPAGVQNIKAIAAGELHSLALEESTAFEQGSLLAWGSNVYYQSMVPVGLLSVRAIAAGGRQSMVLKGDGTVAVWGGACSGRGVAPSGLIGLRAIAGGWWHSLALKGDGTVVAWGNDTQGQSSVPSGLVGVTSIAAGLAHSLAAKEDGTVTAWGMNSDGQCAVPAGLSGVKAVAAGGSHSVALKNDGTMVIWGSNWNGQAQVASGLAGVVAVAAGGAHTLALKSDGTVVAMGQNYSGQCNVPAGLSGVKAIAAGCYHSLAVLSDGTVVGWGYNEYGQSNPPTGLTDAIAVAGGMWHSLALKADGTVVTWGANGLGLSTIPVALKNVKAIAARFYSSLALSQDGTFVGSVFRRTFTRSGVYPVTLRVSDGVASVDKTVQFVVSDGISSSAHLFSDVPYEAGVNTPYAAIHHLALRGIVIGVADPANSAKRLFQPEQLASQAEALSMLMKSAVDAGLLAPLASGADRHLPLLGRYDAATGRYLDYSWATDYVVAAERLGIIPDAAAFDPSAPATREFVASVVARSLGLLVPTEMLPDAAKFSFTDNGAFSSAARLEDALASAFFNYLGALQTAFVPGFQLQREDIALIASKILRTPKVQDITLSGVTSYIINGATMADTVTVPAVVYGSSFKVTGVIGLTARYIEQNGELIAEGPTPSNAYQYSTATIIQQETHRILGSTKASLNPFASVEVPTALETLKGPAFRTLVLLVQDSRSGVWSVLRKKYYVRFADTDGDGVPDNEDLWPNDSRFARDENGNGIPDSADRLYGVATRQAGEVITVGGVTKTVLAAVFDGTLALGVDVAPSIAASPFDALVAAGGSVQFQVLANGSSTLRYRWQRQPSGSSIFADLVDDATCSGSSTATLSLVAVPFSFSGDRYRCVVSNAVAPSATSDSALLSVIPSGIGATHASTGYVPGTGATVSVAISHNGQPTSICAEVLIPDGWSFASTTATGTSGKPTAGATGLLDWSYATVPTSPVSFTYTCNVPTGDSGDKFVDTLVTVKLLDGTRVQFLAQPAPLVLRPPAYHSADYGRDWRIGVSELTRVIQIYNTRQGTSRTGCYLVQADSVDGFAPDLAREATQSVTLSTYHSADYGRDGKLSVQELTRVIQLYNTREGTARTGSYHRTRDGDAAHADGFVPGP